MNKSVHFGWKAGCENRILAPGLPDVLQGTEGLLAWMNGSGLWMWGGDDVTLHPVQDAHGLLVTRHHSVVCVGSGPQWELYAYCNHSRQLSSVQRFQGRSIRYGSALAVVDVGFERQVYDLQNGQPVHAPVGARDAHPRPWQEGSGITWLDGPNVYEKAEGERVRHVARLPGEPDAWVVGPHGAGVFLCGESTLTVHPSGVVQEFPIMDVESLRFQSDGSQILSILEGGTAHIDLQIGQVVSQKSGFLVPVGFDQKPIVLDEDAGILKWMGGGTICRGFSPSAAAQHGNILYGPGGTAWNIDTQKQAWNESPLGGIFLVAHQDGVFQVNERIIGFSPTGKQVVDIPLPIDESLDGEILDVRWNGECLLFETVDGMILVDIRGNRTVQGTASVVPDSTDDEGASQEEHETCPLVAVGTIRGAGGAWMWNEDGMLVVVGER